MDQTRAARARFAPPARAREAGEQTRSSARGARARASDPPNPHIARAGGFLIALHRRAINNLQKSSSRHLSSAHYNYKFNCQNWKVNDFVARAILTRAFSIQITTSSRV